MSDTHTHCSGVIADKVPETIIALRCDTMPRGEGARAIGTGRVERVVRDEKGAWHKT